MSKGAGSRLVAIASAVITALVISLIADAQPVPPFVGIYGSGTGNTVAKFTALHTLGNSSITDNGTTVTVSAAASVTGNTTLGDNTGTDTLTVKQGTAPSGLVAAPGGSVIIVEQQNAVAGYVAFRSNTASGLSWANAGQGTDGTLTYDSSTRAMSFGTANTQRLNLDANGGAFLGDTSGTAVADNVDILTIGQTGTGQTTSNKALVNASNSGASYNTTAGALTDYVIKCSSTATRSAGANNLTNICGSFTASGAQSNLALTAVDGDVAFNTASGTTAIGANANTAQKLLVASSAAQDVVKASYAGAGITASESCFNATNSGTFDTTAALRNSYGVFSTVSSTRSAGANNLVNIALYGDAVNGQVNQALVADRGDVVLNQTSGTTTIKGDTTLGTGTSNAHTFNGAINVVGGPYKGGGTAVRTLIGRQFLTAATGTYSPTTGTHAVLIRMVGGGGGGGSAGNSTAGGNAFSAGGASGIYWEKWIDAGGSTAITSSGLCTGSVSYATGAAGAGGTNGGAGTAGGDTCITINGTAYTAKGGGAGAGMNNQAAEALAAGGTVTAGSSAGDVVFGAPGMHGLHTPATGYGGHGGSTPLGGGGYGSSGGNTAGLAGTGNGGGGGGASAAANNTSAGGAGKIGIIIVEEYF